MGDATVDIIDACRDNGVRVTLLKGVSIGDQHYPAAHLRPMGDIDLLVAERDRGWVEAMMLRRGYTRMAGFHAEEGDWHGTPLFLPELSVWVEIHIGLFPESDRLRRNRLFSPSQLERQTVASSFRGRAVGRFSEELQLVYIASYWLRDMSNYGVHASFVRPLLDAIYLLEASGPTLDWDGMLEWVDNELAAASLYVLLSLLSTRGYCAVPKPVLARLATAQDIVGAMELKVVGAMIDRSLVAGRPLLGTFGERHPMSGRQYCKICWPRDRLPASCCRFRGRWCSRRGSGSATRSGINATGSPGSCAAGHDRRERRQRCEGNSSGRARCGSSVIASRFDHEKHFAAASCQGSHSCRRCSRGSSRTGIRAGTSSPNTCSVLCVVPGA